MYVTYHSHLALELVRPWLQLDLLCAVYYMCKRQRSGIQKQPIWWHNISLSLLIH